MTHSSVPYVPGPSTAPISPPVPVHHAAPPPSAGPVVVGASVDLAHELASLRKLQTTTLLVAGVTLLFALFAMVFSGFVAYELFSFLGALQDAFG